MRDADSTGQHVIVVDGIDGGAPAATGVPPQECSKWQSNVSYLMQHVHLDWKVTLMSAGDFEAFTHRTDIGTCELDFGAGKMWKLYNVINDTQSGSLATQICAIPSGSPAPTLSGPAISAACQGQAALTAAIAALPTFSPDMTASSAIIAQLEVSQAHYAAAADLAGGEGATSAQTEYHAIASDVGQLVEGFQSHDSAAWGGAIVQLNTDLRAAPQVTCT